MVDVRGDVLRPSHGTTPVAVKSNKNQKTGFTGTQPRQSWLKTYSCSVCVKVS